ncbi:MAG TPA: ROK family protein, partial [Phycisphaerales bacterium]|nr:ROK family protein [Phycisphaerales bacterium]
MAKKSGRRGAAEEMGGARGAYIGVDLGGTNMQIGVVVGDKVLGRCKHKTRAEEGSKHVVDRIADGIRRACKEAGIGPDKLAGIGVGAPGAIDHRKGVVLEAPNLRWNNFPLAKELAKRVKGPPIVIDNDVNVAVHGENRLGAGQNASDVLGVWIGTGIGGGLVLDGKLYQGRYGSAGEIGQMTLFPNAALGNRTLEENCSRKHLARRLAQLVASNRPSMLTKITGGEIAAAGAGAIAEAYHKGDALTRMVVDEATDLLGLAIGGCVTLLSLELVILGGGMAEAMGDVYVRRVSAAMGKVVFPASLKRVRVVATELADN